MMPPMHDLITVHTPVTDEAGQVVKDGRGRIQTIPVITKARVSQYVQMVRTAQGEQKQSILEVDLPPSVYVGQGTQISYTDSLGQQVTAQVQTIDASQNLAGRIWFRTVTLG